MSEREPDDTPKPADAPTDERRPRPGDYYYDDATGYEIYRPEEDETGELTGGDDPERRTD